LRPARDYELGRYTPADPDESPVGAGWVTFSAVLLALAGTWNFVDGILAISSSKVFSSDAVMVFSTLHTWGWIVMILGIVQGFAAFALFNGSQFARWFGIVVAGVSAIGQLMFVPAYPWWALAMFALDVLAIYGLAVYGGHRLRPAL
jgi:hypothetical protein